MSGRSATCRSYDHSSTPSGIAVANTIVLPPRKRPISTNGPDCASRASRNSSAASSNCSEAIPWFSWFDENMNARSSNPRRSSGHCSTRPNRISPGSRSTDACTTFLPTPDRPKRRTSSFSLPRTATTLLQRPHVRPGCPEPGGPPNREDHGVRRDADQRGGERPEYRVRNTEGDERDGATDRGCDRDAAKDAPDRTEYREDADEHGRARDGHPCREPTEAEELAPGPLDRHVHEQRQHSEHRQQARASAGEDEWERHGRGDRRHHPR